VVDIFWVNEIKIEELEVRAINRSIDNDGKIGVVFGYFQLEFELPVPLDYMVNRGLISSKKER
jgi:hypothetical protein